MSMSMYQSQSIHLHPITQNNSGTAVSWRFSFGSEHLLRLFDSMNSTTDVPLNDLVCTGLHIRDKPATSTTIHGNVRRSIRMSTNGVRRRACSRASPSTPPVTHLLRTVPSALWRPSCRRRPPSTRWATGFMISSGILVLGFQLHSNLYVYLGNYTIHCI